MIRPALVGSLRNGYRPPPRIDSVSNSQSIATPHPASSTHPIPPGWAVSGHDGSRGRVWDAGPIELRGTGRSHDPPGGQRSLLLSRGGRVGAAPGGRGRVQRRGRSCQRLDAPGRGLGWDPVGAMELLSALSLGELALSFSRVPLFPVFDLSYFIVSILYLKYEPGEPGPGC